MESKEQKLEEQLKSTLRVLVIATKEALYYSDRLIKNGQSVYNRGQFVRLIDNKIDEIAEILGDKAENIESIPWRNN